MKLIESIKVVLIFFCVTSSQKYMMLPNRKEKNERNVKAIGVVSGSPAPRRIELFHGPLFKWSITAYNAAIILLGRCFITNLGLGGDGRKFVLTFQGSHKREMMAK